MESEWGASSKAQPWGWKPTEELESDGNNQLLQISSAGLYLIEQAPLNYFLHHSEWVWDLEHKCLARDIWLLGAYFYLGLSSFSRAHLKSSLHHHLPPLFPPRSPAFIVHRSCLSAALAIPSQTFSKYLQGVGCIMWVVRLWLQLLADMFTCRGEPEVSSTNSSAWRRERSASREGTWCSFNVFRATASGCEVFGPLSPLSLPLTLACQSAHLLVSSFLPCFCPSTPPLWRLLY